MPIPIRSIYYLLAYAWHQAKISPAEATVDGEAGAAPENLLAALWLPEVERLLRQGLATAYRRRIKVTRGLKGKLLLAETMRQELLSPGRAVCAVEELSNDILPNQLLKAALTQLQQTKLAPRWQRKVQELLPAFAEVNAVPTNHPAEVPLPRHQTKRYRFLLPGCRFIQQNLLPVAGGREWQLRAFLEDEKQMAALFEAFVRNFYQREQTGWRVKSEKINWQGQGHSAEAQRYLPAMFTDITLQSATRKIIIDTKFYQQALRPHYQKQRLISPHLYQLFAYLQNSPPTPPQQILEGLLLYPVVSAELHLEYTLSGHKVRICTINLNQPWPGIKADLLRLLA